MRPLELSDGSKYTAAAASPKRAALSGSLKFLPRVPRSDDTIRILLYDLFSIKDAATLIAVINERQVE